MNQRISFNSEKARDYFFNELYLSLNVRSWKELYKKYGANKATFENYRNGKLLLPEKIFRESLDTIKKIDKVWLEQNISTLDSNWGCKLGGRIAYSKNKEAFKKGRQKGLLKIKSIQNIPKIDINMPLNEDLSYMIGLFIGDGFTNNYSYRSYIIQFAGNKKNERDFYEKTVSDLLFKLFRKKPSIIIAKKGNSLRANIYSRDLFLLLTQRFQIQAGRKSKTVIIPKEISESNKGVICGCLAGLYDAEANIFLDSRKVYKTPYPRLDLHMNNPNLLRQVSKLLSGLGIVNSITNDLTHVYVYGKKNIQIFLSQINMRNKKNLIKLNRIEYISTKILL